MSSWDIYWLLKLDDIRSFLGFADFPFIMATFLGLLPLIFVWICSFEQKSEGDRRISNYRWHVVVAWVFCIIAWFSISVLHALTPTTKQMATIMVAPKIINNDFVQEELTGDAKEIYDLGVAYIKKNLEIKPEPPKGE